MRLHLRLPRDWSSWPWVPWNFSPKWKILHRTLASHVNFCVFFSPEWNHLLVSWWRNALANSGFSDAHFSAVFSCSQSLSLICRCNARTKSSSDSPSAELSMASAFWLTRPPVESVFCAFPSFFAAISERTLLTVFCILLSPRTKRSKNVKKRSERSVHGFLICIVSKLTMFRRLQGLHNLTVCDVTSHHTPPLLSSLALVLFSDTPPGDSIQEPAWKNIVCLCCRLSLSSTSLINTRIAYNGSWVPGISRGFHLWHSQPLDRITPHGWKIHSHEPPRQGSLAPVTLTSQWKKRGREGWG